MFNGSVHQQIITTKADGIVNGLSSRNQRRTRTRVDAILLLLKQGYGACVKEFNLFKKKHSAAPQQSP